MTKCQALPKILWSISCLTHNWTGYLPIVPSTSKVHPVFHVPLLKLFFSLSIPIKFVNLLVASTEIKKSILSLAILNSRIVTYEDQLKFQVLVQWEGLPVEESSWEDLANLIEVFPKLNLETQV